MSLLNMSNVTPEMITSVVNEVAPQAIKQLAGIDKSADDCMELMQKGFTLAEIYGITEDELGAVYEMARRDIAVGQVEKAKALFIMLVQISPMEPHFTYGLATAYQIEGDVRMAVRLYSYFLAMDATNPQGYLRLGECLLASGEYKEARDAFQGALNMFTDPVKNYDDREYAKTMMASAREHIS